MPCVLPQSARQYDCTGVQKLIPGAVYAPFVSVTLGDEITVGNKSSPPNNYACIKSFEYGGSDGQGCKVEIFDEQGGSFDLFMEKLNKTLCNAPGDYNMKVDFGWVITDCTGAIKTVKVSDYGGPLTFLPHKVDAAYEQGKIKFTIEGRDLIDRVAENRVERNQGTESQKVRARQAIKRLLEQNCPSIRRVNMLRRTPGGGTQEWNWRNSDGGPDGPMSVWPADQQNALATIRKWMNSFTTDRKKGVTPAWDCGKPEPTLVFWEDFKPAPGESDDPCGNNLGTYIVNGGNCTPVISFNPKAEWFFGGNQGSGGNAGGSTSQRQPKHRGRPQSRIERAGTQTTFSAPQNDMNWRPPDQITNKMQQAVAAQEAAARQIEGMSAIEAELKIQGDPRYAHPVMWQGMKISIIVVNPFHIFGPGGNECGDWMALPVVNKYYSNKRWMILSVHHAVKEGSYTTTIKVRLDAPNVDIEPGVPLGGPGSGGPVVRNSTP